MASHWQMRPVSYFERLSNAELRRQLERNHGSLPISNPEEITDGFRERLTRLHEPTPRPPPPPILDDDDADPSEGESPAPPRVEEDPATSSSEEESDSESENEIMAQFLRVREHAPDFPLLPSLALLGVPRKSPPLTPEERYKENVELEETAFGLYVSRGGRAPFPFDLVERVMNDGRGHGENPEYGDVVAGQYVEGRPMEPHEFTCWSLWARWSQFEKMRKVIRCERLKDESEMFSTVRPLARLVRHLPPPKKEWNSDRFGDWGFADYKLAVMAMAKQHGVTQNIRLRKKLKNQHLLSTWVEYYYYEAYWFKFWVKFTKSLEREYQSDFQALLDSKVLRPGASPEDVENFDRDVALSEEKLALEDMQMASATVSTLEARLAEPMTSRASGELEALQNAAKDSLHMAEDAYLRIKHRNSVIREFLYRTREHRDEHRNIKGVGRFLKWIRAQIVAIEAGDESEGSITPTPEASKPGKDAQKRVADKLPHKRDADHLRQAVEPAAAADAGSSESSDLGTDSDSDFNSSPRPPASKRRKAAAPVADGPFMRAYYAEKRSRDAAAEAARREARQMGRVKIFIREDNPYPLAARRTDRGDPRRAAAAKAKGKKTMKEKADKGKAVVYDARLPSEAPSEASSTASAASAVVQGPKLDKGKGVVYDGRPPAPSIPRGDGGGGSGGLDLDAALAEAARLSGKRVVHVISSSDDEDGETTPTPHMPRPTPRKPGMPVPPVPPRNSGTQAPPPSPPPFRRITYQTSVLKHKRDAVSASVAEWQRRLYRDSFLGAGPSLSGEGGGGASRILGMPAGAGMPGRLPPGGFGIPGGAGQRGGVWNGGGSNYASGSGEVRRYGPPARLGQASGSGQTTPTASTPVHGGEKTADKGKVVDLAGSEKGEGEDPIYIVLDD